jgi:hypothetical protein
MRILIGNTSILIGKVKFLIGNKSILMKIFDRKYVDFDENF